MGPQQSKGHKKVGRSQIPARLEAGQSASLWTVLCVHQTHTLPLDRVGVMEDTCVIRTQEPLMETDSGDKEDEIKKQKQGHVTVFSPSSSGRKRSHRHSRGDRLL